MKRGKRLVLLTSLLFLLFLLLLLVLPLTTASNQNKTTPATIIPAPLGSIQITDNKITTSAIIDDTQFLIDLQTGQIIHTKKLSPSGLVLTEDGVEGAGVPYDGYEKDEAIYITKDGRAIDPHANVFLSTYLPTLGSELGNSLWGAAKSIGTLGIYNAYQSYKYNFANPPATWGEVGLRTIDQTPVAGSVKAAIESDNWVDATSNGLNALGSGILIGTGLTAKFAPNTYARLGSVNVWGGEAAAPTSTALVKYDPEFAMEQIMRSGKPGTVILYHHTDATGYVSITSPKPGRHVLIWGSPKSIAADAKPLNKGFVYLTDIPKIQTEFHLRSLFAYPFGPEIAPPKTIGDFSSTIKLRVPVRFVEKLSGRVVPDAIQLAPHIYRIPCAIGGPNIGDFGAYIKPTYGGYYNVIKVDGFRTPRPMPPTIGGGEWMDLIYRDRYP